MCKRLFCLFFLGACVEMSCSGPLADTDAFHAALSRDKRSEWVSVVIELSRTGSRVVSANFTDKIGSNGAEGPLEVLDAAGNVIVTRAVPPFLGTADFPGSRNAPGGIATLSATHATLLIPWPAQASSIRLAGQHIVPENALTAASAASTTGSIEHIYNSGNNDARFDLVILGDGYQSQDLPTLRADAQAVWDHMSALEPFNSYKNRINVWVVLAESIDRITGRPTEALNTPYGCHYNSGINDWFMCCDETKVSSDAALVASHDATLVIVNDDNYGGAGFPGAYAVTFRSPDVNETTVKVAAHELGHAVAFLGDEYNYGIEGEYSPLPDRPNCAHSQMHTPWNYWIGKEGVAAFRGCGYTNLFRPTRNDIASCLMDTLDGTLCAVCRESWVKKIFDVSNDPDWPTPIIVNGVPEGNGDGDGLIDIGVQMTFSANVDNQNNPPQSRPAYEWTLNTSNLFTEALSYTVEKCQIDIGTTTTLSLDARFIPNWMRPEFATTIPAARLNWNLTRTQGEACTKLFLPLVSQ